MWIIGACVVHFSVAMAFRHNKNIMASGLDFQILISG